MRGLFRKNANLEDENGSFKDCKWEKTTMDISSTITELSANPKGIKFARLVVRNLCNDGLIGTGPFPGHTGLSYRALWRLSSSNLAFHTHHFKNVGLLVWICDCFFGEARQRATSHRVYTMPWKGDPE